jgi:hypothetical protein
MCAIETPWVELPTMLGVSDEAIAIPLGTMAFVFLIVVVVTIGRTITKTASTRQREQSRREIAAYVAEGSISPDDAVRMLAAGKTKTELADERQA